ncbi:DUF4230 domain-containing protein [Sphingomonas hylomeconis]|uniref:DUF4230 domain-containing protein n=1 Tax=Sphingomonas hylomeconis TaxID=1395958 RepID=A0ABV7T040_9SPHN|nr:DUF4230 domain-containing protein [Sphingomonas hylomeconis]
MAEVQPPLQPQPQPNRPIASLVAAIVAIIAALVIAKIGYDKYSEKYVVERRDDGVAVDRIVRATFTGASALKVGSLSGTVQSTASDVRGFGMLSSDKVVKAPFSVDYFVDMARMGGADYRWDQQARVLTILAPDVTVGAPNVDESATSVSETRGLYVTRAAAEALARQVSIGARRTAEVEARKPERIAAARENARRALAKLLGAPLEAAGVGNVRVAIVFPFERSGTTERWDASRSPQEILANAQ